LTICVGIQVNDGLVFAADSAVTITYGSNVNVFSHGNKVFNLHRQLPVCAMFSGLGNIGASSISSIAKDFRLAISGEGDYRVDPGNFTIKEVAEKAKKFIFDDRYNLLANKPNSDLMFHIGGYSSGGEKAERWLVKIVGEDNTSPDPVCQGDSPGLNWSGQPEAIYRLIMGVSMNHMAALKASGLDDEQSAAVSQALTRDMQANVVVDAMPIQDAIDLADFLVETTKRYVRFLPGADTVGGETDIAVVTRHEGFKWIRRKHHFSRALNPLPTEIDYAR